MDVYSSLFSDSREAELMGRHEEAYSSRPTTEILFLLPLILGELAVVVVAILVPVAVQAVQARAGSAATLARLAAGG